MSIYIVGAGQNLGLAVARRFGRDGSATGPQLGRWACWFGARLPAASCRASSAARTSRPKARGDRGSTSRSDASANDIWSVVREFGALDTWFPFVSKCKLIGTAVEGQVGAIRSNTVADGALIEETLIELSDRDRRITYDLTKGDVPTIDYSATLTIHEATVDDRAFAVWTARFDIDGDRVPVVAWVRDDIFKVCLEELERVAQRRGSRQN